MTFSDWITIVSILTAVLFATFRFDEWEIIRLKNGTAFALLPISMLLMSGVAAYFHSNPHPGFLDVFWPDKNWWNFNSGLWPIIWTSSSIITTFFCWRKFVSQPPSDDLILEYVDLLKVEEPVRFSALFRKYEQFFFTGIEEEDWLRYEEIFRLPKFWTVAPVHFKEVLTDIMRNHTDRFFEMNRDVMTTILQVQLSSNDTQLMEELEYQPAISDQTPLLNFFLSTSESIEHGRSRNILIPTVKDVVIQYLSSYDFLERDRRLMILKPIDGLHAIPSNKLRVFYYINFINWYWVCVIHTRAKVAGFYQYEYWTDLILKQAPKVDGADLDGGGQPNHYAQAVNQIMRNIHDWVWQLSNALDEPAIEGEQQGETDDGEDDMKWAFDHFLKLKLMILKSIREKHFDKVVKGWFIAELSDFMKDVVTARQTYGKAFDPSEILRDRPLPKPDIQEAFEAFTDDDYPGPEQESEMYKWMTSTIDGWQ